MPLVSVPIVPPAERPGLLLRGGLVCVGALLISVANALLQSGGGEPRFDVSGVYTFGISLSTWAFIDGGRFLLRGALGAAAPSYWPASRGRAMLLLGLGIAGGYVVGTLLGDRYAGRSTLELLGSHPTRFYGILVGSLVISIGAFGFFYQRGRSEVLSRQAQTARLDLLLSQLEPHMLFNTLANLRVLIGRDPPQAQAMLDRLVAFLRTTLVASRLPVHPLAVEFERIADYLALVAMRMGPRLQVDLDLPAGLRDQSVPTLLLQPLVENAVRHGLEPAMRGGLIAVSARFGALNAGPVLELTVRDTGVGLSDEPSAGLGETSGYGLVHVRDRLATLYGPRAELKIEPATDGNGGTLATIRLPLSDRSIEEVRSHDARA